MTAALTEEGPGRFTISQHAAPSVEDRAWLEQRLEYVLDALTPGYREKIEDKLHEFIFGFSSFQRLDVVTLKAALLNYVQAVDHLPLEAVNRACEGWNKHKFKWANPAFPPQPPEFAKAATEMLCEIKMEARALRNILGAQVSGALPPPRTEAERDADVEEWRKLRAEILSAASTRDDKVTQAGSAAAERRAALDYLAARKLSTSSDRTSELEELGATEASS